MYSQLLLKMKWYYTRNRYLPDLFSWIFDSKLHKPMFSFLVLCPPNLNSFILPYLNDFEYDYDATQNCLTTKKNNIFHLRLFPKK